MLINYVARFSVKNVCIIIGVVFICAIVLRNHQSKKHKSSSNAKLKPNYASYISPHGDYDPDSYFVQILPKPYYFQNGTRYPEPAEDSMISGVHNPKLFPFEGNESDHIVNQMMYVPPDYNKNKEVKTILAINGFAEWWNVKEGTDIFSDFKCPVDRCRLTTNHSERSTADMILFHDTYVPTNETRPPRQINALYHSECPFSTSPFTIPDVFNWTISYRIDSTIPIPYSKWMYYDPRVKQMPQTQNYALNKTKKVAWFVSNCWPRNNRMIYARELQKYIQVDIYGRCGTCECPRSKEQECFGYLQQDYKFYLAFENANCKDYITEKLFKNSLEHNILPIVMGAPRDDYEKYAPLRSFIHVDDFESPKALAEYLHLLDSNDNLYNSYFKWKGTGELIDVWKYLWCRLCALLHDELSISANQWYANINEWWRGPGVCTRQLWWDTRVPTRT